MDQLKQPQLLTIEQIYLPDKHPNLEEISDKLGVELHQPEDFANSVRLQLRDEGEWGVYIRFSGKLIRFSECATGGPHEESVIEEHRDEFEKVLEELDIDLDGTKNSWRLVVRAEYPNKDFQKTLTTMIQNGEFGNQRTREDDTEEVTELTLEHFNEPVLLWLQNPYPLLRAKITNDDFDGTKTQPMVKKLVTQFNNKLENLS